jgi:hypothetical protein
MYPAEVVVLVRQLRLVEVEVLVLQFCPALASVLVSFLDFN